MGVIQSTLSKPAQCMPRDTVFPIRGAGYSHLVGMDLAE
jgi:hypothetical protein